MRSRSAGPGPVARVQPRLARQAASSVFTAGQGVRPARIGGLALIVWLAFLALACAAPVPARSPASESAIGPTPTPGATTANPEPATSAPGGAAPAPPAPPAPPAGEALLRFAFTPGETHRYTYDLSMTAETPATAETPPGAGPPIMMTMGYSYRVLALHPDGSGELVAAYDRLAMSTGGQTRELPEIAGTGVRLRVYPNGSTSDVRLEQAPVGVPPEEVDVEQLGRMFMSEYPAQPLPIGASFERAFPLEPPGYGEPLTLHSRVTLNELLIVEGRRMARLSEMVSMPRSPVRQAPDPQSGGLSLEAQEVTAEMSGSFVHLVDLESGWPISGDGTLMMDMSSVSPLTGAPIPVRILMGLKYQKQ